jgi:hypothetical protein
LLSPKKGKRIEQEGAEETENQWVVLAFRQTLEVRQASVCLSSITSPATPRPSPASATPRFPPPPQSSRLCPPAFVLPPLSAHGQRGQSLRTKSEDKVFRSSPPPPQQLRVPPRPPRLCGSSDGGSGLPPIQSAVVARRLARPAHSKYPPVCCDCVECGKGLPLFSVRRASWRPGRRLSVRTP